MSKKSKSYKIVTVGKDIKIKTGKAEEDMLGISLVRRDTK